MKSIMHQKDGTCYLCMLLHDDYRERRYLEEHHAIFGTRGRELSEKYGLKIYLCEEHHRTSIEAVHVNHDIAALIQDKAQRAFERHYPKLDWMEIFGRNYKIETPAKEEQLQQDEEFGFKFIEEE